MRARSAETMNDMIDAQEWPLVSICIPVKNGGGRLGRCLKSLREVDYPSERLEIIIADGRSTDDTVQVARAFGCTVLDNPHQIVASGRNIAFGAANGEFIASTDDDCMVPRDWVRRALASFDHPEIAAVGGTSLLPADAPPWACAANYVFRLACLAGYSVQSDHLDVGDAQDLPGCNTFYRSDMIRAVGEFDEALVTAEDVDLHRRLTEMGKRLRASRELFVWHDKRPSPRSLFRQMRRFAEGRVQLDRKARGSLRPMHRLIGWFLPASLVAAVPAIVLAPVIALPAIAFAGWALLAGMALRDGEGTHSAMLVAPAAATMVTGWSWGYLKESWLPMRSTRGR